MNKGFSKKLPKNGGTDRTFKNIDREEGVKYAVTCIYFLCVHLYSASKSDAGKSVFIVMVGWV